MHTNLESFTRIIETKYSEFLGRTSSSPYTDIEGARESLHSAIIYFLSDENRIPDTEEGIVAAVIAKTRFEAITWGRKDRRNRRWGNRTRVDFETFSELPDCGDLGSNARVASEEAQIADTDEGSPPLKYRGNSLSVEKALFSEADTEQHDRSLKIERLAKLQATAPNFLNCRELAIFTVMVHNIGENLSQTALYAAMDVAQRSLFHRNGKSQAEAVADVGRKRATMQAKVRKRFGTWADFLEWGG